MDSLSPIPFSAYTLSDVLGVPLNVFPSGGITSSGRTRKVDFVGLKLEVPVEVISSYVADKSVILLVRLIGNLGIMVMCDETATHAADMCIIDFAKMGKPETIFERLQVDSTQSAYDLMDKAVVGRYQQTASGKWSSIE